MTPIDAAPLPPRRRGRPPLALADIAARRERIVAIAARMFFAAGFADTKVEAIGREAGVTKRTIYQLVGDKRALFRAACGRLRADGPHFEFSFPTAGLSARDVLRLMAERLIVHSLDKELLTLERAVIAETRHIPDLVSAAIVEGRNDLMNTLTGILSRLVADGALPPLDLHRAAMLFYDATVGARGFRAVFGHPPERASASDIDERVDMFLAGYVLPHRPDSAVADHPSGRASSRAR